MRKRRKSGCAHGLSLLITCHIPTPPSSVTSTGPALVCQTLLSSPCLSQSHKSPLFLYWEHTPSTVLETPTHVAKPSWKNPFLQLSFTSTQDSITGSLDPVPQFSNTQSSPTRTLRLPVGLGSPWPGQAPLTGCWDPGDQLKYSLCSGLQLHLGGWYMTLTFISEKNNFLHTRWRKRTISRACVASPRQYTPPSGLSH